MRGHFSGAVDCSHRNTQAISLAMLLSYCSLVSDCVVACLVTIVLLTARELPRNATTPRKENATRRLLCLELLSLLTERNTIALWIECLRYVKLMYGSGERTSSLARGFAPLSRAPMTCVCADRLPCCISRRKS